MISSVVAVGFLGFFYVALRVYPRQTMIAVAVGIIIIMFYPLLRHADVSMLCR